MLIFKNSIPSERNKIKHKTPSTHCGPIFLFSFRFLFTEVFRSRHSQIKTKQEKNRTKHRVNDKDLFKLYIGRVWMIVFRFCNLTYLMKALLSLLHLPMHSFSYYYLKRLCMNYRKAPGNVSPPLQFFRLRKPSCCLSYCTRRT